MRRLILISMCWFALAGCATTQTADDNLQRTPTERLRTFEASIASLEKHPLAERVSIEISTARSFLQSSSSVMATGSDDQIALRLAVTDGQIVKIKSAIARIEAEMGLENTRLTYEQTAGEIQSLREINDAVLKQEKDQ